MSFGMYFALNVVIEGGGGGSCGVTSVRVSFDCEAVIIAPWNSLIC